MYNNGSWITDCYRTRPSPMLWNFAIGKGCSMVKKITPVCVSYVSIQPSKSVKRLGVTLDKHLSFDEQVDNVSKSVHFSYSCSTSHPWIPTRWRNQNRSSLYYNLSSVYLAKLQRVQNTLACLVLRKRKYEQETPALVHLHWLPIKHCVIFKLLVQSHYQSRHTCSFFTLI